VNIFDHVEYIHKLCKLSLSCWLEDEWEGSIHYNPHHKYIVLITVGGTDYIHSLIMGWTFPSIQLLPNSHDIPLATFKLGFNRIGEVKFSPFTGRILVLREIGSLRKIQLDVPRLKKLLTLIPTINSAIESVKCGEYVDCLLSLDESWFISVRSGFFCVYLFHKNFYSELTVSTMGLALKFNEWTALMDNLPDIIISHFQWLVCDWSTQCNPLGKVT
jgi:hypothetical protein